MIVSHKHETDFIFFPMRSVFLSHELKDFFFVNSIGRWPLIRESKVSCATFHGNDMHRQWWWWCRHHRRTIHTKRQTYETISMCSSSSPWQTTHTEHCTKRWPPSKWKEKIMLLLHISEQANGWILRLITKSWPANKHIDGESARGERERRICVSTSTYYNQNCRVRVGNTENRILTSKFFWLFNFVTTRTARLCSVSWFFFLWLFFASYLPHTHTDTQYSTCFSLSSRHLRVCDERKKEWEKTQNEESKWIWYLFGGVVASLCIRGLSVSKSRHENYFMAPSKPVWTTHERMNDVVFGIWFRLFDAKSMSCFDAMSTTSFRGLITCDVLCVFFNSF